MSKPRTAGLQALSNPLVQDINLTLWFSVKGFNRESVRS